MNHRDVINFILFKRQQSSYVKGVQGKKTLGGRNFQSADAFV